MAPIRTIEELAHHINICMRAKPPRILAAGDMYNRSGLRVSFEKQEILRKKLGWSKPKFCKFSCIGSNRVLSRHREFAPIAFSALYELARCQPEFLQTLFDQRLITPDTTAKQARVLVKGHTLFVG